MAPKFVEEYTSETVESLKKSLLFRVAINVTTIKEYSLVVALSVNSKSAESIGLFFFRKP